MTSRDPERSKLVTPIRLERNISKTAGDRERLPFQRTTNRKWHMEYQMVTSTSKTTSRDLERSNSWPQYA